LKACINTGNAVLIQREICRAIKEGGGDYFFTVTDNRQGLKADIALAFVDSLPRPRRGMT